MTIDEALKILEDILTFVDPLDPPEEHDSIKLGIEGLKLIKQQRVQCFEWLGGMAALAIPLLPGETLARKIPGGDNENGGSTNQVSKKV